MHSAHVGPKVESTDCKIVVAGCFDRGNRYDYSEDYKHDGYHYVDLFELIDNALAKQANYCYIASP